jgi:1-deoxy-D-xylulose-5-phosphate synthase
VAIYSTFLQRGYDQLIHDVTLQNLPIVFAIDRAGMVGADGPTHAGVFDVAFLRCLPNLVLMTPSNQADCRNMLTTAFSLNGPSVVRYPRGSGEGPEASQILETIPIGKGTITRRIKNAEAVEKKIAFVCFGPLLYSAMKAAEELDATVADMRFVKPLDEALLLDLAKNHDALVFIEDSAIQGGAGSACLEVLSSHHVQIPTLQIGLPDEYVEHGDINLLLDLYGLSPKKIQIKVQEHFQLTP